MPQDPLYIDVGGMRARVTIQQQGTATDSYGQQTAGAWTTVRESWAKIATAYSKEVYLNTQFTSEVTHMLALRWTSTPLSAGMRVLYGSRVFMVQAVENVQERNVRTNLMCVEINGAIA